MAEDSPSVKKRGPEPIFKTFQPLTRKFNDAKGQPEVEPSNFEFINAEGSEVSKASSRRAARAHVMRRYHNEKRAQIVTGNPDEPIQHPSQQRPMSSEPMIFKWHAPISKAQAAGTHPQSQSSAQLSLLVSDVSIRPSKRTEQCSHCSGGSKKGKQAYITSTCVCKQPHPQSGLEPPFLGAFPVDRRSLDFLQFSIHEVAKANIPMGTQAEVSWFTQATSSPAFFHGTLLLGATYRALALSQTSPFPPECYYHQAKAIRHIITNLDDPKIQLQEGNVAAVACLAAFETTINHTANEYVHIDGLERLITVRKAKKQDGLEGYLQKLIQWVDISHASANLVRPRFLSLQANIPIPATPTLDDELRLFAALNSKWPASFPSSPVRIYEGMDDVTGYLFHRARQLSSLATRLHAANPRSEAAEEMRQQYTQGMLMLEGQVNASIWSLARNNVRQHGSATQLRASDPVRTCTRTWHGTTLLYIHLFLRRTHPRPRSVMIAKVATRVKYSLRILTEQELWEWFPKQFLLWVLCVIGVAESHVEQSPGAAGEETADDRTSLLRILGWLRGVMGLEYWEEAKEILMEFAWVEHLCNIPCRTFWEESDKYVVRSEAVVEVETSAVRPDEDIEAWPDPNNTSHLHRPNLPDRGFGKR